MQNDNGSTNSPECLQDCNDRLRVKLDFLSKALYPLIALLLIGLLYPYLENLVGKVESIQYKDGGIQVTFSGNKEQDLAQKLGPINNQLALIRQNLSVLEQAQQKLPLTQKSEAEKKLGELAELFKKNSKYSVLVFHQNSTDSQENSEAIMNSISNAGYQSSNTETDFSELKKIEPKPGTVHITYGEKGKEILGDIKTIISKSPLKGHLEIKPNDRAIELRRGDIQILVF